MNEKQLSKAEIQQIFQFMENNGVKFYDVQLELVDHFASEIEQNWDRYPKHWTFGHKIVDVYNRIGRGGFTRIIKTKSAAINKWFRQYCWNYIKSFFSWPKILITALLMGLFYTAIMHASDPIWLGKWIILIGIIIPFFLFTSGIYLKIYLKEKAQILSVGILYLMQVLLGINAVFAFLYLCKITTLDQTIVMPYILTILFAFCVYYFTASALAFNLCYKDFKSQYPKLT